MKLPATPEEADRWMQKQPSFSKAQNLVHPDIHYSYPVVTKKAGSPPLSTDYATEWREFIRQFPYGNIYDWLQFIGADNKQGNITANECNDIIRKLNLKSFESGYKILLMWMPEFLGKEGNKLLKLIEEPPDETVFILVAEGESGILSTILSRCQLVRIPALETAILERELMEKSGCSPDQARLLANASEGNYREAKLHTGTLVEELEREIKELDPFFSTLTREQRHKVINDKRKLTRLEHRLEELTTDRKRIYHSLRELQHHVRGLKNIIPQESHPPEADR